MALVSNISPMPQFQPQSDPTNTGARWTVWVERYETYLIAADVKEGGRKRALLFYQAEPEVYKIFKILPDTGDNEDYTKAKDALTKHFKPAKNPIYETYIFSKQNKVLVKPSINYIRDYVPLPNTVTSTTQISK